MNKINIAFICDSNYALPTRTAVNSVIRNKKTNTKLHIYIIAVDLTTNEVKNFEKMAEENVEISVIEKSNIFSNVGLAHHYVSKAALFKFSLPELIPSDKVLYLDGDIIVQEDLSELYNTDISKYYAATVKDMEGMVGGKHHIKLNHQSYFNSGVMLLNLEKMRQSNMTEKLLEAKRNDTLGHFMDQDALNVVFHENTLYLHPKYNFMAANLVQFSEEEIKKFYDIKTLEKPVVLHLTNIIKPWNNINAVNSELWLQYVLPEDLGCVIRNYFSQAQRDDMAKLRGQEQNLEGVHKNIEKLQKNALSQQENIEQLQYQNKRLNEKIKKMQKGKISARCKRLLKKLFYKNKNNKKKFRLLGIPLFSLKKQSGKKVFKILGIKFSIKEKVDKRGGVNQELKECAAPIHDLVNDYRAAFNKCGYSVERKNGKIIIRNNKLIIEGIADNTLWTAASVLCNDEYHFDCAEKYTMFDIGLNLGITSLYKAQDKNCIKIYGYEPFTPTFKLAERNMKLNPKLAQKISIFNYGLGDCDKEIKINYNPERPGAMSSVKNIFSECSDVEKIKIKPTSKALAPLIKTSKGKIFLKIDCEGAEKEILPDLHKSGLLKKVDIIVMEWHFENPQWIIDLLTENNFIVFRLNVIPDEIGMIRAYRNR